MDDKPIPEKALPMPKRYKIGLGIAGVVFSLQQMKQIKEFISGDAISAVDRLEKTEDKHHDEVMQALKDHVSDEYEKRKRVVEVLRGEIVSSENRCSEKTKDLKADIRDLQIYAFKPGSYKKIQN